MKPAPLEYVAVESTDAAIAALERFDGTARVLAGGQSLVPLLSMRLVRPSAVIDVNRIAALDRVETDGAIITLGALARYSTLEWSPVVHQRLPLLARAIPFVGDRQIRNRGTIGGALCHADPAGEIALCAVTAGATLVVRGRRGTRRVPAREFFRGPYTTAIEPDEMLIASEWSDGSASVAAVVEHARRHGDFAVVSVAATGVPGAGGRWASISIGLGAVADRPIHADAASAMLAGTLLDDETIRAAGRACVAACDPGSDVRASAEYRRHLVPIYVERALARLRERGREPRP